MELRVQDNKHKNAYYVKPFFDYNGEIFESGREFCAGFFTKGIQMGGMGEYGQFNINGNKEYGLGRERMYWFDFSLLDYKTKIFCEYKNESIVLHVNTAFYTIPCDKRPIVTIKYALDGIEPPYEFLLYVRVVALHVITGEDEKTISAKFRAIMNTERVNLIVTGYRLPKGIENVDQLVWINQQHRMDLSQLKNTTKLKGDIVLFVLPGVNMSKVICSDICRISKNNWIEIVGYDDENKIVLGTIRVKQSSEGMYWVIIEGMMLKFMNMLLNEIAGKIHTFEFGENIVVRDWFVLMENSFDVVKSWFVNVRRVFLPEFRTIESDDVIKTLEYGYNSDLTLTMTRSGGIMKTKHVENAKYVEMSEERKLYARLNRRRHYIGRFSLIGFHVRSVRIFKIVDGEQQQKFYKYFFSVLAETFVPTFMAISIELSQNERIKDIAKRAQLIDKSMRETIDICVSHYYKHLIKVDVRDGSMNKYAKRFWAYSRTRKELFNRHVQSAIDTKRNPREFTHKLDDPYSPFLEILINDAIEKIVGCICGGKNRELCNCDFQFK